MSNHDRQYLSLVKTVLDQGTLKTNRTGIDTISTFGHQMKFDLRDGTIPLLTTKKMFTRGVIREILWYLQGSGNIGYLKEHGVSIWDEWANEDGDLGPVYGQMWRRWPTFHLETGTMPENQLPSGDSYYVSGREVDQIAQLVRSLKTNPDDRRMLVTAWNPALLPNPTRSFSENVANGKQALPPCHYTFQCYAKPTDRVGADGNPIRELSLMLNQRSCDVGLGVPFNIVQYSILLRMLCEVVGMVPGDFIWNGGDIHIYTNHLDGLSEQLTREPFNAPTFSFARSITSIDDFKFEDFLIEGYQHHDRIDMDVAV